MVIYTSDKGKIFRVKGKTVAFLKNNKCSIFVQVLEDSYLEASLKGRGTKNRNHLI